MQDVYDHETTQMEGFIFRRAEFPLIEPYELSFGKVDCYQSVVVEALSSGGRNGFSEATIITGYTPETVEKTWETLNRLGPKLAGLTLAEITALAETIHHEVPFGASALVLAAEMAANLPLLSPTTTVRTPILALVSKKTLSDVEREIEDHLASGYRVLKVKVGFDVEKDLKKVHEIQKMVRGRAQLRIDANQGYDKETACNFISRLDPESIELVEQTCAAGDWHAARAVAQMAEVPLMLDETIYNEVDIDRAAEYGCASYIKTKVMKAGGARSTLRLIERIRTNGMIPVLGNGAAMDLSCRAEALIAGSDFETCGEMNGFLKTPVSLLDRPFTIEDACIVISPGDVGVREETVRAFTIQEARYL